MNLNNFGSIIEIFHEKKERKNGIMLTLKISIYQIQTEREQINIWKLLLWNKKLVESLN